QPIGLALLETSKWPQPAGVLVGWVGATYCLCRRSCQGACHGSGVDGAAAIPSGPDLVVGATFLASPYPTHSRGISQSDESNRLLLALRYSRGGHKDSIG